ncbi:MAG: hypothetical protein Q8S31_03325 [Alphaproteobacteria bacterium]|nr:hypothetical protein [Alphaproteobacteria bacterium]
MFKKSILVLGAFFILSNSFAMGPFPSLEELKLQFEKLGPTLDMQMQATANALANTEPTTEFAQTEFGKMMSAQIERLKQDSNRNTEVFDEEEHDEIKQDNGEKTEPLTEEKVDVMEMLIELMEKERRDAFQRSLEDRDFMRLLL